MERTLDARSARRLTALAPLPLDPHGPIAIKRDVHDFEVATDAATFTRAFREVVTDAASTFGLIRIRRPVDRMGQPFDVGERFQGCFSLERALLGSLERRGLARARRAAARLLAIRDVARAVTWIEDRMLSNYAEIEALELSPAPGQPFRLRYRYLDG